MKSLIFLFSLVLSLNVFGKVIVTFDVTPETFPSFEALSKLEFLTKYTKSREIDSSAFDNFEKAKAYAIKEWDYGLLDAPFLLLGTPYIEKISEFYALDADTQTEQTYAYTMTIKVEAIYTDYDTTCNDGKVSFETYVKGSCKDDEGYIIDTVLLDAKQNNLYYAEGLTSQNFFFNIDRN